MSVWPGQGTRLWAGWPFRMRGDRALRVLAVEDEALLLMELEALVKAAGHDIVASAMSLREAIPIAETIEVDLALVDLHLADGHTGLAVGRYLTQVVQIPVVYVTASERRIPAFAEPADGQVPCRGAGANDAGGDYGGAVGVIAKPYTRRGLDTALAYLAEGLRHSAPRGPRPPTLFITPAYAARWQVAVR